MAALDWLYLLAAIEKPEQNGAEYAEEDACDNGEVHRRAFASPHDIAGETTERQMKPVQYDRQYAQNEKHETGGDEESCHGGVVTAGTG